MSEKDILRTIREDAWMMNILMAVKSLNLPDCWVGGGFIRSKIWDMLHGYTIRTPLPDVDVVYLDSNDFLQSEALSESTKKEKEYESQLRNLLPEVTWSATNQARMHLFHNTNPYKSSKEAMKDWVETATGVGARLNKQNELEFIAAWGISDLVNLVLTPASHKPDRIDEFNRRIISKDWLKKWPKLKVKN